MGVLDISAPPAQIQRIRENEDSTPDKHPTGRRLEVLLEPAEGSGLPQGSSASVAFCSVDD